MKFFILISFFLVVTVSGYSQPHQGCQNVDFHDGFDGWSRLVTTFPMIGTSTCRGVECVTNTYNPTTTSGTRFTIFENTEAIDPYGCFPVINPGSSYSLRLGNNGTGAQTEQLVYDFVVDAENPYFIYHSAIVLEDRGHSSWEQPFFDVRMYDMSGVTPVLIECATTVFVAASGLSGFSSKEKNCVGGDLSTPVRYRPWYPTNIDLSDHSGKTMRIVFTTADCAQTGHFGYAYITSECIKGAIQVISDGLVCKGRPLQLGAIGLGNYIGETYLWNFDGETRTDASPVFTPSTGGTKHATLTVTLPSGGSCSTLVLNQTIVIPESCDHPSCTDCITSFSPMPGKRYLLSAWVREPLRDVTHTFLNTGIRITYNDGDSAMALFRPAGPVIDGWQRIEQSFTIPAYAYNIQVELVNESEGTDAFFDDIRIHPFQSNMKSFVYDPSTQQLVAELDENNYATYYEYDDEGILIRVKKETERGIMTIKESRNNQSKLFKD